MAPTVIASLKETLYSGYIGQGEQVELFEKELSAFIGNPYVLTVNSGSSALWLALRLAGVGAGDEVVTTPMTCTATNWPILGQGAKIVWADIDPDTGNVSPETVKKTLTNKTKAIMVVDWGGYPCDIDGIRMIAGEIPIIEDAAHAFGTQYYGKKVGNAADYTCFSFQAIKHLTTVDGGMLAVRSQKQYERGKLLRWYGIDRERLSQQNRIEIDVTEWGYKFHMNNVNATIGRENLKHTEEILLKNRDNAAFYRKLIPKQVLLCENPGYVSSYWLFTIKVPQVAAFISYMENKGIMVSQVHRRNDTHPVVSAFARSLPGVDAFVRGMVCIPVGWWVGGKDCERIADAVIAYLS